MSEMGVSVSQVDRICNAATAISTAGASDTTSGLLAGLDGDIEALVEGGQEATLVKILVELVAGYGDEESAELVLSRALAAASRSEGYGTELQRRRSP